MPRILFILLTLCALLGCQKKGRDQLSELESARFAPSECLEAFLVSTNALSGAPLLIRTKAGETIDLPCEWPVSVYREETGRFEVSQQEDGTAVTTSVALASSPTNLYFISRQLAPGCPELPLPFDSDDASSARWEALFEYWKSVPVTNAFIKEALFRIMLAAPQRVARQFIPYEDFREAFLAERSIKAPKADDLASLWARTYFYLRTAAKEKRFEDVKKIALDSLDLEGRSPEWHAIMGEYLKVCDPTRIKDIEKHYARSMSLFAKKSKGIPFYRVWVEKTGLEAFIFDSETVISHYYTILESLKENEAKGSVTTEFAAAIREQAYTSIAKLLLRYDQTANAYQWAARLLAPEFSREAKLQGLDLIFQAAEKNGQIFDAIGEYDTIIKNAATKEEKNFWRLEKGVSLIKFDLPEEATALYGEITADDPGLEKRQFSLTPENQDARFMHLYYYVLRVEKDDMRDLALSNLRKRGILNRADSTYYLSQAAQLQVCMQRLKEAYNIYESIYKEDNIALLEYIYLLYRNSHYDQCVRLMRTLPYHKNSDVAKDWRFSVLRLFRARRIKPPVEKVINDFSTHTNELTRARYLNGLGNIYQSYRQSDKAAQYYKEGIEADPLNIDNYLDLGFLYCMSSNKAKVSEILDQILALPLTPNQKRTMLYDWRAIEFYYTSDREMPEEDYE